MHAIAFFFYQKSIILFFFFQKKSLFCPIATSIPASLSPLPTSKAKERDLGSKLTLSYSILSFLASFQVTTDNEAEFFISLHGAGDGELKVYGEAPYGHFPVDLLQSPKEKDTYVVRYTPRGVGEHKIHINFAGEPVKGSPYIVKVRHSKHARLSLFRSSRPVPSRHFGSSVTHNCCLISKNRSQSRNEESQKWLHEWMWITVWDKLKHKKIVFTWKRFDSLTLQFFHTSQLDIGR